MRPLKRRGLRNSFLCFRAPLLCLREERGASRIPLGVPATWIGGSRPGLAVFRLGGRRAAITGRVPGRRPGGADPGAGLSDLEAADADPKRDDPETEADGSERSRAAQSPAGRRRSRGGRPRSRGGRLLTDTGTPQWSPIQRGAYRRGAPLIRIQIWRPAGLMGAGQGSLKSDVPGEALAGRLPRPAFSRGSGRRPAWPPSSCSMRESEPGQSGIDIREASSAHRHEAKHPRGSARF